MYALLASPFSPFTALVWMKCNTYFPTRLVRTHSVCSSLFLLKGNALKGSQIQWPKNCSSLKSEPQFRFNTQNMTNSTLVSPVKMEYGWNFSISGLKMMMKSGLGKIFLKFLHVLKMLSLLLNLYFWSKFSNKNDMVSAWRPEMLKFHPYYILTGDARVDFVIYCVLKTF